MKITDLNAPEEDFFTNKTHSNIKKYIANCTFKIEALRKENAKLQELDLFGKYFKQFTNRVPNATVASFENSPEQKQLKAHAERHVIHMQNVKRSIIELKETINQLKIQDLFNKQQSEFEKKPTDVLPIPTVIPSKILTGPQTYIDNPYYMPTTDGVFAGTPWEYTKWTKPLIQKYSSIIKILQKLNEPTFSLLYVSKKTSNAIYNLAFVAANYTVCYIRMTVIQKYSSIHDVKVFYKGLDYSDTNFIQKYK